MNAHLLRGRLLMQQNRHEQAVPELRLALAEAPDSAEPHADLAMALLRSDRWQEASESAKTALAKDPESSFVHWVMTLVWLERSHLKEAEESIRRAIELNPDDADNHGLLARVLLEKGRKEEALAAADAGLALDPKDDMSLTFRARALMALGRKAEAGSVADTLLSDNPDDAWNHCLRGDQLINEGSPQDARQHYLEALRLEPGLEAARQGFATCLKSRSPVYGVLLKVLLAAGKLRGWSLWLAVILIVAALRFGDGWALRHAEWLVTYEIAKGILWMFVLLLAIANPLFDVLLRFDRDGRRALSDDELKATNWYLVCFAFAALCSWWALSINSSGAPKRIGFGFLFLTQAIGQTFCSTAGNVRTRMTIVTWIAAGCLVMAPVAGIVGIMRIVATKKAAAGLPFLQVALWLPLVFILISAFSDNIREWFEKRRPDGE